jgi:hypothetical protein
LIKCKFKTFFSAGTEAGTDAGFGAAGLLLKKEWIVAPPFGAPDIV